MVEFKSKKNFIQENDGFSAGHVQQKERTIWSLHGHEFFEVELFLSGEGYQILNGERYEIMPGSIHLLTTSDFHEMVFEKDIEQIVFRFEASRIDTKLVEKIFSVGHAIVCKLEPEDFDTVRNMMRMIYESYMDVKCHFRELFIRNMLESVIILLLRKVMSDEKNNISGKNHIQRAIAYIEMNFKDDPGLDKVAAYVGLNSNYFSSLFRKETGKSFVRYVIDLKLEYSKNLIRSSAMTMNEICFSSGFNSFGNFSREFKKKYNITPLQYRKKKKGL